MDLTNQWPPPTPPRPDPNIAVRDEQDMKRCKTSSGRQDDGHVWGESHG